MAAWGWDARTALPLPHSCGLGRAPGAVGCGPSPGHPHAETAVPCLRLGVLLPSIIVALGSLAFGPVHHPSTRMNPSPSPILQFC